jgi:hypothetical protein
MVTFDISNTATAPPHVEHGWLSSAGQPAEPALAELPVKTLLRTLRYKLLLRPDTDMAPPLVALQLMKLHCDTTTLLSLADTAPPGALGLEQAWKAMPAILTVELTMLKAGPGRLLQSNTVCDGTPLTTSDATLVTLILVSLNTSALRMTRVAPMLLTANVIVLQGAAGGVPQASESKPVLGSTMMPSEANASLEQPKIDAQKSKRAREHAAVKERGMRFSAKPEQAGSTAVHLRFWHCHGS